MLVQIGCMYSDDWDYNIYEEDDRIRIDKEAIEVFYKILENEEDEDALNGREGTLSTQFDYELHNGKLCAIIGSNFVPCEDEYYFECYLEKHKDGKWW